MDRVLKKVNQEVNLERHTTPARQMPACPDIAIIKDGFSKNPSKNH